MTMMMIMIIITIVVATIHYIRFCQYTCTRSVYCVLAHTVLSSWNNSNWTVWKEMCGAGIIGLSEVGVHWKELRQSMWHVVQPETQWRSVNSKCNSKYVAWRGAMLPVTLTLGTLGAAFAWKSFTIICSWTCTEIYCDTQYMLSLSS